MHYHLILTELCNSHCRYCYEKSMREENDLNKKFNFDFSSPPNLSIKILKLKRFLSKDPQAVLIFYGGEPLLQIEKIKKIIDSIDVPFRMQTNGKLLNTLPINYLKKIDKILISLDGSEERTDFNRGKGTSKLVLENIHQVREKGYNGEIIARMTITPEFPDICEQVQSLIKAGFTSIHWQIDAGFYKQDFNKKKFQNFVRDYNISITELIKYWINDMELNHRVLKLYPFIGIIESLLTQEPTLLRCGSGHSGYTITTDGKIVACPIMNSLKDFEAGNLNTSPTNLKKFDVSYQCTKCEVKEICGGRCLYWNQTQLWPREGNEMICQTVKHLINNLQSSLPKIKELIEQKKINQSDFEYEKYFGPEIIP